MKSRNIVKTIGFVSYLLIVVLLAIMLYYIKGEVNFIASGLRPLFTYLIIGLAVLFAMVCFLRYISTKNNKLLWWGIIGITPCLVAVPFFEHPGNTTNKTLSGIKETVNLQYVAWACYCPRWVYPGQLEAATTYDSLCMHVEPVNATLVIPDSLRYSGNVFRFTGEFYVHKQYSKDIEDGGLAKTFRYDSYQLIDTTGIWTQALLDTLGM